MWLALLFMVVAFMLDYGAFKTNGKFASLVLIVMALGSATIGAYFITATNPVQNAAITITTSSGNTVISPYNSVATPSTASQTLSDGIGEVIILIQAALVVVVIGYLIFNAKKERKERMNM